MQLRKFAIAAVVAGVGDEGGGLGGLGLRLRAGGLRAGEGGGHIEGEEGFGLDVWRAAGACDTVPTRIQ